MPGKALKIMLKHWVDNTDMLKQFDKLNNLSVNVLSWEQFDLGSEDLEVAN